MNLHFFETAATQVQSFVRRIPWVLRNEKAIVSKASYVITLDHSGYAPHELKISLEDQFLILEGIKPTPSTIETFRKKVPVRPGFSISPRGFRYTESVLCVQLVEI